MKTYIQHGQISTSDHVMSVVYPGFYLNRRIHLGEADSELVRGVFLYDFYLYVWQKTKKGECDENLHSP